MQPVSIRFEKTVLDRLRRLAHAESLRRDADVSMADLIREAVLGTYAEVMETTAATPTTAGTTGDNPASGGSGPRTDLRGMN